MATGALIQQGIEIHRPTFEIDISGSTKPVEVISPYATVGSQPDTIISTGFTEKDVLDIAMKLQNHGLTNFAVHNTVYPSEGELTNEVIEQSIVGGMLAIVHHMNRYAGRSEDTPVKGAGHSAGAAAQIKFGSIHPKLLSKLVENSPPGVNPELPKDESELNTRFRVVKRRMFQAGLINSFAAAGDKGHDLSREQQLRLLEEFKAGLKYALQQDGVGIIQDLHSQGLMDRLYVAGRDHVFPARELAKALRINRFVKTVGRDGHVSLRTAAGIRHMANVIRLGLADSGLAQVAT